jgi:hypothetical protein
MAAHMQKQKQAPPRQGREVVPVAQLYAILDREFKLRRPAACTTCAVPLPYWRKPPDDVSANWFIGTPRVCGHGCDIVIAEILAQLWTRYDVDRTPPRT